MPRKLKTFLTTSGFFELAVAAPSRKAALEIWGSKSNQFQQGFAKETSEPDIVEATMAQPGVVLRRPIGTRGAFKEQAELPKVSALEKAAKRKPEPKTIAKKARKPPPAEKTDASAGKKAAQLYDLAQKRREREERREQQERQRLRERREAAIARAEAALDTAKDKHAQRLAALEKEQAVLDRKLRIEKERWQEEKQELDAAIKRAAD